MSYAAICCDVNAGCDSEVDLWNHEGDCLQVERSPFLVHLMQRMQGMIPAVTRNVMQFTILSSGAVCQQHSSVFWSCLVEAKAQRPVALHGTADNVYTLDIKDTMNGCCSTEHCTLQSLEQATEGAMEARMGATNAIQ